VRRIDACLNFFAANGGFVECLIGSNLFHYAAR
jgi:hypothetical protein